MSETTQKIREEFGHYAERTGDGELLMLVNDADHLAAIERDAKELSDACRSSENQLMRAVGDKLRTILDSPEGR